MNRNKISCYCRDSVIYTHNKSHFIHNFEHDYQIVLVQESKFDCVKLLIEKHYNIISEYDLIWTKKHLLRNKQRLGIEDDMLIENVNLEDLNLKAIIFEIDEPEYQLTSTGKYQIKWNNGFFSSISNDVVLLSSNIEKFFSCAALLTGLEFIKNLSLSEEKVNITKVYRDLIGAEGWHSFDEMFAVTNICADWLVLRNAEFLPNDFWGNDKDMDILCRDLDSFLMATNATKKDSGFSNYEVMIESKKVDVDARFLGDDYYDRLWQEHMLLTKVFNGIVPLLDLENHFFSLLYHARIHKSVIKPIYITRLIDISHSLGFIFDQNVLTDDELCAQFFDDFFDSKNYKFTFPYDFACYENINRDVTKFVMNTKPMCMNLGFTLKLIKNNLFLIFCKLSPRTVKDYIKRVLGK